MSIARLVLVLTVVLVSACGAEVATTAGTVGALQVEQLKQAQEQQRKIESGLGAALKAGEARSSAAAEQ